MNDLPDITVIMCTRNRARQLGTAFDTLHKLEYAGAWEMVLVDNGSTDGTAVLAHDFARDCQFDMHVVEERRAGLSRARNRGLSVSQGEIVAFLDDDCYPAPDYLASIAACFARDDVGFAGGRVLLYDLADYRITVQELNEPFFIEPASFIRSGQIHGANMAFRRRPLLELRGFDERLGAGSRFSAAEDSDAQRRMSYAGWTGAYDPAILVYHHHGRKTQAEVEELLRGYDRGIGACMVKYLIDPRSRRAYASGWYWKLREISFARCLRQIGWASLFFLLYGPTRSRLHHHPAECLDELQNRSPA